MKVIFFILFLVDAMSSLGQTTSTITYDAGTTIEISSGADVCADTLIINGTYSGGGTICSGPLVGIEPVNTEIPKEFKTYNNYPNPFNPVTKIKFDIPVESFVNITVYDITGREIDILVNENLNAGRYEADFNGAKLSSGVYFYRIEAGGFRDVKKMTLLK